MSDMLPLATYSLNVEPYTPVPAIDVTMPITIRITMAALNPEAIDEDNKPSTLRIIKRNPDFEDDDFLGGDFDEDEMDEDSSSSEEEAKVEKKKKSKGKKAEIESSDEDEEENDEDDDDEDEDDEFQESVLLTLSPEAQYQQSLDLTIAPEEEVQFIVTGSYAISLSGNYIKHPFDTPMGVEDDDEDEDADIYDSEDYDLTPDEDEIIGDDLDDLDEEEEVRIEEVQEEEEEEEKSKPEPKKSKKEKKRKHDEKEEEKKDEKKAKKVKKVEFKKDLEEGPTKPKSQKEQGNKQKPKTKVLEGGIAIEERTVGDGPQAKRGARVGMRYIGKLKNGKIFDKNTSGKPFAFKLGRGEVIKGWDIGVAGMCVGGERRIVIPAPYAYGKQALPGIPANSELTFDVKLVSMKN
ncbi:fpr3p [Saccharomyces arboricola H-6]|uniref:FK506-binding protein n=1 Tax=Saccharomyces arboricola (strain H-6 / AS 2.3317 / CBS 10644) TaxID=1160507 RepID=J8Q4H8_SACAR|nr:fpr3p [Saccharomyces arboricola H-6]